ncbi:kinase-like domain-containing protein [Rhizophagus clarus]|uniref:Kinase-like domain-containing protein n=1 Tax=Rhizophagus clarus TaxID=94130 RepID=A0A8H3LHY4_9GLOM|nr:kinase-like domain-containing protein [Rhizophagus clarus]
MKICFIIAALNASTWLLCTGDSRIQTPSETIILFIGMLYIVSYIEYDYQDKNYDGQFLHQDQLLIIPGVKSNQIEKGQEGKAYLEGLGSEFGVYGVLPFDAPEILREGVYTASGIYSFGMIIIRICKGEDPLLLKELLNVRKRCWDNNNASEFDDQLTCELTNELEELDLKNIKYDCPDFRANVVRFFSFFLGCFFQSSDMTIHSFLCSCFSPFKRIECPMVFKSKQRTEKKQTVQAKMFWTRRILIASSPSGGQFVDTPQISLNTRFRLLWRSKSLTIIKEINATQEII